jgi:nicotinate-nucleotide adenylyltransferase
MNLAIELSEKHNLQEVWFCPAHSNPHKTDYPPVEVNARLEMLRLATKDMQSARVLDLEANRPNPSYTIDTVRYLIQEQQQLDNPAQLFLLLGQDSLEGLSRWKDIHELVELIPFLFGARNHTIAEDRWLLTPKLYEAVRQGMTHTRIMEISSTEIRERICQRKYCGHLVPKEVLDYIYRHGLYFHSNLP